MNYVEMYFNKWLYLLDKAKTVKENDRKSFRQELNDYSKGWERLSFDNQGEVCEKIRLFYASKNP